MTVTANTKSDPFGPLKQNRLPGASFASPHAARRRVRVSISPMRDEAKKSVAPIGERLAVDRAAASATQGEPGFIARPAGAPVYHGFQVVNGVAVDGFTFGKITDFEAEGCGHGDAFVIAPDNSRAGLVREVSEKFYFQQVCPLEPDRWGVWAVTFPHRMESHDHLRRNLESVLPELKKRWEEWRHKYTK
jgi:hypothetical protein